MERRIILFFALALIISLLIQAVVLYMMLQPSDDDLRYDKVETVYYREVTI